MEENRGITIEKERECCWSFHGHYWCEKVCYDVKKAHFCKCWLSLFFVVAISHCQFYIQWIRTMIIR